MIASGFLGAAARIGRETRLSQEMEKPAWAVFQEYRRARTICLLLAMRVNGFAGTGCRWAVILIDISNYLSHPPTSPTPPNTRNVEVGPLVKPPVVADPATRFFESPMKSDFYARAL
jgi:hypothetical protein